MAKPKGHKKMCRCVVCKNIRGRGRKTTRRRTTRRRRSKR